MTTVRHIATSNGRHSCPFPKGGCTSRTCDRRPSLPPGAVFAAVRKIAERIHPDPLAGIIPSVTIPPDDGRLTRLLADAVKPSTTWNTEPPTAADLRATYERLRDQPPSWEPQPYVIHPRHYDQAKRDGCMCVLGMVPCPWHTAVKVGDPVTWIDRPLGGAEDWPFTGWTVARVRAPGGVPTSYDLAHTGSDHRVIGATRDQFRVADPSREPSPATS